MNDNEIKAFVARVKNKVRVTKVVATRSVKTGRGDHFAGFSAAWDSVQEDGTHGLEDLVSSEAEAESGMTLKEARIAYYLVARNADIAAFESAMANGNITPQACMDAVRSVKSNYSKLIRLAMEEDKVPETKPEAE